MVDRAYPLVSVIVPTYNRSKLLQETVESVLAQTYPNIELIVVDDGSTDDTPEMLQQYAGRLIPIRQQNQGGTAARNTGIAAARGAYLNFLDHDDLFLPTKIARQMQIMQDRPEVGLVHCGYYRMDKDGRYIDIVNFLPEGDVRATIVLGCFCWSGAPLIRRECIEAIGVFDETVWSSDADMWLRIALAGYHFGCVQEPLGAYRIMPDSSMADVERTERMDMVTLDRVFADVRLPEEARANRKYGYFNQRFWLACRYYTLGRWEDAQRNLNEAVRWRPDVLDDRFQLLHLFCTNALDPRVAEPVAWVNDVFDHLPAAVGQVVGAYRDFLNGWVLSALAMRDYALGQIYEARQKLTEAVRFDPTIAERDDDFGRMVCDYALRLPVVPGEYVTTVMGNLPPEVERLAAARPWVFSEVNIASAFREFQTGRREAVPARVLSAVRTRPALLRNRGVLSIFARSLPAWLSGRMADGKAVRR